MIKSVVVSNKSSGLSSLSYKVAFSTLLNKTLDNKSMNVPKTMLVMTTSAKVVVPHNYSLKVSYTDELSLLSIFNTSPKAIAPLIIPTYDINICSFKSISFIL